jgi:hypothetical protein
MVGEKRNFSPHGVEFRPAKVVLANQYPDIQYTTNKFGTAISILFRFVSLKNVTGHQIGGQ